MERGSGAVTDLIVFAALVSTAMAVLVVGCPVDPEIESMRYASSLARWTLSALNSTADELGGFEYMLSFSEPGLIPFAETSSRRALGHKTVSQLLSEDVLLNLHVEVGKTDIAVVRPASELDIKLRDLLTSFLNGMIKGRFNYRLIAETKPVDLGFIRVYFEMKIENMDRAKNQLCSETVLLSLPVSNDEFGRYMGNVLGAEMPPSLKVDPVIEVSLELWSI